MTTLLPESTDEITTTEPARGGRRLLVGLIGLLVLALVVAGAWLLIYQPLRSGQIFGVQAPGVESVTNSFGTEYRVMAPEPGETISMWIELRNDGPLGITIVSVGNPFNPDGVVDPSSSFEWTTAGRLDLSDGGTGGELTPVTGPFALAPATAYEVRLSFDVLDCATLEDVAGGGTGTTIVPVTYRVFGLTRTVDLEIGYAISIVGVPTCP